MNLKPSLYEHLKWDEDLQPILENLNDVELDESTLSRLIGKQRGGQLLVKWLHQKHRLSNEADLQPASFSERLFWKQFKSNPDNFVIISAENGVAGIKPSMEYIQYMIAKFAKKNKTYSPSGDSHLQYQAVAFTDDGKQIDPKLLQQKDDDSDEVTKNPDRFISTDPTVIKARMGKHSGKDTQNPDNVFNLLSEQIGALRTVWISGFENVKDGEPGAGSVERSKMQTRAGYKASPAVMPDYKAIQLLFAKIEPVLPRIVDQAARFVAGKIAAAGENPPPDLGKLKTRLDTIQSAIKTNDIMLDTEVSPYLRSALSAASGAAPGTPEYTEFANEMARGRAMDLRPLLDALRNSLIKA